MLSAGPFPASECKVDLRLHWGRTTKKSKEKIVGRIRTSVESRKIIKNVYASTENLIITCRVSSFFFSLFFSFFNFYFQAVFGLELDLPLSPMFYVTFVLAMDVNVECCAGFAAVQRFFDFFFYFFVVVVVS